MPRGGRAADLGRQGLSGRAGGTPGDSRQKGKAGRKAQSRKTQRGSRSCKRRPAVLAAFQHLAGNGERLSSCRVTKPPEA